jgi:hypothetical protein
VPEQAVKHLGTAFRQEYWEQWLPVRSTQYLLLVMLELCAYAELPPGALHERTLILQQWLTDFSCTPAASPQGAMPHGRPVMCIEAVTSEVEAHRMLRIISNHIEECQRFARVTCLSPAIQARAG